MSVLRIILFPFSILYGLITSLRNWCYDRAIFKSTSFSLPIISVGNLTVGGTGKTPMTEYLIRLFVEDYQISTLSRGYGRKTKGFRVANVTDTAQTLGDEPYQIFKKFDKKVSVCVGEKRVEAVHKIKQQLPNGNLILLDDAFQHRAIKAGFSILLSDYARPFYQDWMMPTGNLREARSGAQRADVVVVTKCPNTITDREMESIKIKIDAYTRAHTPVYFAKIDYLKPIPVFGSSPQLDFKKVFLLTAIANAKPLKDYLSMHYQVVHHSEYPDHHAFDRKDVEDVAAQFSKLNQEHLAIVTTEKDMVKLIDLDLPESFKQLPIYYLPIGMSFVKEYEQFNESLKDFCSSTRK